MTRRIAALNVGASSLKLALLDVAGERVDEIRRIERERRPDDEIGTALHAALAELGPVPDAFAHRVVHGGVELVAPTMLTDAVERRIEALVPLAPLHNGPALAAIRHVRAAHRDRPSVAVFDTAFHAERPDESMQYALPRELVERFGIRRYGFHGIAHASLAAELALSSGTALDAVDAVTLQLGAGCSACAIAGGRSIETSMGYTPLEGLVMATRCGSIDPAIVLRLIRAGYDAGRIEDELGRRSGLRALCGTGDVREVLAAEADGREDARFALQLFCRRIVATVGAYFTLLGGAGALVFGGGIGTNSPPIRERIARALSCWNVALDAGANGRNAPGMISAAGSRPVYVLRTNEEAVMAREVDRHLGHPIDAAPETG